LPQKNFGDKARVRPLQIEAYATTLRQKIFAGKVRENDKVRENHLLSL